MVVLCLATSVGGLLAALVDLPHTLGYILGGMLVGPSCLDAVARVVQVMRRGYRTGNHQQQSWSTRPYPSTCSPQPRMCSHLRAVRRQRRWRNSGPFSCSSATASSTPSTTARASTAAADPAVLHLDVQLLQVP